MAPSPEKKNLVMAPSPEKIFFGDGTITIYFFGNCFSFLAQPEIPIPTTLIVVCISYVLNLKKQTTTYFFYHRLQQDLFSFFLSL
jgi:hypothetical protein